jgi:hypothetical protein
MLTYTILQFVQHLESVQVEFRHDDLPNAFARMTLKLPVDSGAYPSGEVLDAFIRDHAPDRAWFETQETALIAAKPELSTLPPELAAAVPVENVVRPARWDQTSRIGLPVLRNGKWIKPVEVVDLPGETPAAEVLLKFMDTIANVRYVAETSGVTLGADTVNTDRESQATITSAWAVAKQNSGTIIDWKASSGWVRVDAATMIAIGDAVFAHVQSCFSKERQLAEQAALCATVADLRLIDYEGVW